MEALSFGSKLSLTSKEAELVLVVPPAETVSVACAGPTSVPENAEKWSA